MGTGLTFQNNEFQNLEGGGVTIGNDDRQKYCRAEKKEMFEKKKFLFLFYLYY